MPLLSHLCSGLRPECTLKPASQQCCTEQTVNWGKVGVCQSNNEMDFTCHRGQIILWNSSSSSSGGFFFQLSTSFLLHPAAGKSSNSSIIIRSSSNDIHQSAADPWRCPVVVVCEEGTGNYGNEGKQILSFIVCAEWWMGVERWMTIWSGCCCCC